MDKLKQWVALTMLGIIAIVVAGWFLLISPKRSEAAGIEAQAAQQTNANSALQTQIQVLKSQAKQLPQQQAKLAAVQAKIPDNPALPTLIRVLSAAADDAGVELVSMAPGQPTAVAAPVAAAPVAAGGAAGAAPTTATTAVASSAGALQSIGLTLNVVGGYFQVEQFLDRVESLSRALKVTGFTLAPGANPVKPAAGQSSTDGSTLSAAITGTVYLASGRSTVATAAGK
ncbi:MAG: hypothetical protein JWM02_2628 [Frankiales bacterium]|nr:hypothetical protein [Frankiales bacterium]